MPITFNNVTFGGGLKFESAPPPGELTLVYNATSLSSGNLINVPLKGTVNVSIDWGDGTSNTFNAAGYANKRYTASGNYTVKISGTLTGLGLANLDNVFNGDRLLRVVSFGDVGLTDLSGAFKGCDFLTNIPNVLPQTVSTLERTFEDCTSLNDPNIANWNTSKVTNLASTFEGSIAFNQPIGNWNVSNVANLRRTFTSCRSFNQDLSGWDVSNVTNMAFTFFSATVFNGNITNWNTSNVTNTSDMFYFANNFNQPIGNWNTAKVTDMSDMFNSASKFNQPIGNWNTSNVTNFNRMFSGATIFNQNLNNWCVSKESGGTVYTYVPDDFSPGSALTTANSPFWSTCPALVPSSTITFLGSSSNAGNTVSLPAHQAGDVFVAFAYRGNSTTTPGSASWSTIGSGGSGGISYRAEYRRAANSSTPNPTWTNATNVIVLAYRGANSTTPIAPSVIGAGRSPVASSISSTTTIVSYPVNGFWYDDSWVVAFAGHNQGDGNMQIAPAGLTARANVTNSTTNDVAGAFDSNGIYGSWPVTTANIGGTNGTAISLVVRLLPTLS